MKINVPLFESDNVCLGPIDHEKDPEIESNWTHDMQYLRQLSSDIARPLSPAHLKKKYENIEKEMEEGKNVFYFTIRMRSDDRLIGFARLFWIEWSNGSGRIELGIGNEKDRQQGYGSEALKMVLRYAFAELNLFRLSADVPEYNEVALRLFTKFGFLQEVRRRQALNRYGRRWDLIQMGILQREWEPT
jgi:RimJ/RimL family protein N-acetyltransferase